MPLGLDPGIILQGRPPQIENPLVNLQHIGALRQQQADLGLIPFRQQEMQAQAARLAQETEKGNMDIKSAKEDEADEKTFQQAWTNNGGDWDKTMKEVTPKIGHRTLSKYEAEHNQATKDFAARTAAEKQQALTNSTLAGNDLMGVLEADPEQRQAAWDGALERAQAGGYIAPATLARLPKDVPDENGLKSLLAGVGYSQKLAENDRTKAAATRAAAQAKREEESAKRIEASEARNATQRQIADAAQSHLGVGIAGTPEEIQAAHTEWLAGLPKEISGRYQNLKTYSPAVAKTIQDMALTPQQLSMAQSRTDNRRRSDMEVAIERARGELGEDADVSEVDALAMKYKAEMQKEGKVQPAGAGGRVAEQQKKEWRGSYDKAAKVEADLYTQLHRYEDAINAGGTYLEENSKGLKAVPMDQHAKNDDKVKAAAIDDMKQRANIIRDKIKNAIQQKYTFADRLGFTGDKDLDTATSEVEGGKYGASGQQSKGANAQQAGQSASQHGTQTNTYGQAASTVTQSALKSAPVNTTGKAATPPKHTAKTVRMKSPTGDVADVAEDQVAHYESLGAKRVP